MIRLEQRDFSRVRILAISFCLLVIGAISLSAQSVTLSSTATPATAPAGTAGITLTGTGFPSGTIDPSAVSVTFEPATTGAGATVTTPATAIVTVVGTTRRVSFSIPSSLAVMAATPYLISVAGATGGNASFSSSNKATITLISSAGLLSTNPTTGQAGQSVAVVLRGQQTHFLQGATQATFGDGISVGAGGVGGAGPVFVVSPTVAVALVNIGPTAASGPRSISVKTESEVVSLANAFAVSGSGTTSPSVITLGSSATPDTALPGTTVTLLAANFPSGAITANQISILLEPAVPSGGPILSTQATAITDLGGGQRQIAFVAPSGFSPSSPVAYLVSVFGSTSDFGNLSTGFTFASGTKSALAIGQKASLVSSTPNTAPQGATLTVTLKGLGTNFVQGVTLVNFGSGISVGGGPAGSFGPVTVSNGTTITAQIKIDANAQLGVRLLQVSTGNETAALTSGFTVQQATLPPALTSVVPGNGQQGQSLQVVLAGANTSFDATSVVSFGSGISVDSIAVNGATGITAQVTISPGAALGSRTVTVTTGSQVVALANSFTVLAAAPVPVITSIAPASSQQGQSLQVTITGQGTSFLQSATTVSFGAGITVTSISVASPTVITAQISVDAAATTGTRTISVTTGAQVTAATNAFTIQAAAQPSISGLNPSAGQQGQSLSVAITGKNTSFSSGSVLNFGQGVTITNLVANSALLLTAQITIAADASLGYRTLAVTTGSQSVSLTNAFLVQQGPQPVLSLVSPSDGQPGQTLTVILNGQNNSFSTGSTVSFGANITINGVTVANANSLSVQLTISPNASAGPRTISITTGTQTVSLSNGFTVKALSQPTISLVNPLSAQQGQTIAFGITGQNTHFASNTIVSFGSGITVSGLAAASGLSITGQLTVAPNATVGSRVVTVTTGTEIVSAANTFSVQSSPAPVLSSISPANGQVGQSFGLTIVGQNTSFSSASSINLGAGISVSNISATNATTLVAQITIASSASLGARTLTVVSGDQTLTLANAFTVLVSTAPVLTSLSPSTAQQGQTLSVNIVGKNTAFTSPTSINLGLGVTVSNIAVVNAGLLTAQVSVSSSATPGLRTLTVNSGVQTLTLENAFIITAVAAPTLISVSPAGGQQGQTVPVTITGSNTAFSAQSTIDLGSGITISSIAAASATSLTAQLTIASTATVGQRPLTVTTGTQTVTLANAFTVAAPTTSSLLSIAPSMGQQGQTVSVTVTGANTAFSNLSTLDLGTGITASNISAASATSLTAQLTIASTATVGQRTLAVTTGTQTVTLVNAFTVGASSSPSLLSIAPSTGQQGQTVSVTITGVNTVFSSLSTIDLGAGIAAANISAANATSLTAQLTIASTATVGQRTLTVTTGTQTVTLANAFTVAVPASAGTISSLTPTLGVPGASVTVVVLGQNTSFVQGSTQADFGASITVNSVVVADATHATIQITIASDAAIGARDVKLTTNGATATATSGFRVAAPGPQVTISSPASQTLFTTSPITVTGTVSDTKAVVQVNGVTATVSGNTFTASGVPLAEAANTLVATATNADGVTGSASVMVTLDTTPPTIGIDTPTNGAIMTSTSVTVSGMVNDIVSGTINAQQVTVSINGLPATVSNRSFEIQNLLLVRGQNTITAVATDRAGNKTSTQVTVTIQSQAAQQTISMISGNAQSGQIGTQLPAPLQVQLLDANSNPVTGRAVTFTVRRSDGMILTSGQAGQMVTLNTDSKGFAQVLFQLGTHVGAGMNQVQVTSPGFLGETIFCATSTPGAAVAIRSLAEITSVPVGVVGQTLSDPLKVIALDSGGNPVANVPIVFKVQQGGGNLAGQTTYTGNTDSDGRVSVLFALGIQEGISNNVVIAALQQVPTETVSFQASGVVQGATVATTLSGVALDNSNNPIPHATASIQGTTLTTFTDDQGRFKLTGVPPGFVILRVDGATSTRPEKIPFLTYPLQIISGQDNSLGKPAFLPFVDLTNAKTVGGNSEVILTMAGVPGVAFTVAPNSVTFPDGSHVGSMSLSQVHADKVPHAPPYGTVPKVVWTLQPAGALFNPPIKVQLPNTDNLAPGQVVEIFQIDHDLHQFVSIGMARVSADGSVLVTDPGFGITKAGWGVSAPPPPPKKCVDGCQSSNPCQSASCIDGACVSTPTNEGGQCGDSKQQCGHGVCHSGSCVFDSKVADGTECTPDDKCLMDPKCKSGICTGEKPDLEHVTDDLSVALTVEFPDQATTFLNDLINQVPGLEKVTINKSKGGVKGNVKACCDMNTGMTDRLGIKTGSASFGVSLEAEDIPLFPLLPPIHRRIPVFSLADLYIDVHVGLFLAAAVEFQVEGGYRTNSCDSTMACGFASASLSATPALKAKIEGMACGVTFTDQFHGGCIGIDVTPLGVKLPLTGWLAYNKDKCGDGGQYFVGVGKVVAFAEFKFTLTLFGHDYNFMPGLEYEFNTQAGHMGTF